MSPAHDVFVLVSSAGVAVSAGALALAAARAAASSAARSSASLKLKLGREALSGSLRRWAARAEKEMKRSGLLGDLPLPYVVLAAVLAAAAFTAASVKFRNPLASVLAAALALVAVVQWRVNAARARREKVIEQLGAAVRVFAAEYGDTPLTAKALDAAARRMPEPIAGTLREAAHGLSVARSPDDVDRALLVLGKKLSGEYGRMFAQLLRISVEDQSVKPLFTRLAARITAQQDLIRRNRVEVGLDRALAMVLNLLPAPAYFFVGRVVPEARDFFLNTAAGKLVICLCLISAVLGSLMDILLGGAGDV